MCVMCMFVGVWFYVDYLNLKHEWAGQILALCSVMCAGFWFYLRAVWMARDSTDTPAQREVMRRKLFFVVCLYVWTVFQGILYYALAALVFTTPHASTARAISVLSFPLLCVILRTGAGRLAQQIHPDAAILGCNLASVQCNIFVATFVGVSAQWDVTALLLVIDVAHNVVQGLIITQGVNALSKQQGYDLENGTPPEELGCCASLAQRLLFPMSYMKHTLGSCWRCLCCQEAAAELIITPENCAETVEENQRQMAVLESHELIVPTAYIACWLTIMAGGKGDAYAGIGVNAFGMDKPDGVPAFVENIAFLIVGQLVSIGIAQVAIQRICDIHLYDKLGEVLSRYGSILAIQSVWVIQLTFCGLMLTCGMDLSVFGGHH